MMDEDFDEIADFNNKRTLQWHESLELIFSELLDESQVRAYFHKKSHEYFSKENIKYQLPIIIFSAIAGSGNFISSTFPSAQEYIILAIGGVSICTSIVSSISQFLKLSQLSEGHRIAYLSWEKFYANIKLQIRRKKDDRDDIKDFMNNITAEYQRLKEISPEMPPHITKLSKKQKKQFHNGGIQVPFIFDKFQHITAYGTELRKRSSKSRLASSGSIFIGGDDDSDDTDGRKPPSPSLFSIIKNYIKRKLALTPPPEAPETSPPPSPNLKKSASLKEAPVETVASNMENITENWSYINKMILQLRDEMNKTTEIIKPIATFSPLDKYEEDDMIPPKNVSSVSFDIPFILPMSEVVSEVPHRFPTPLHESVSPDTADSNVVSDLDDNSASNVEITIHEEAQPTSVRESLL
jgi:hypothetical protein